MLAYLDYYTKSLVYENILELSNFPKSKDGTHNFFLPNLFDIFNLFELNPLQKHLEIKRVANKIYSVQRVYLVLVIYEDTSTYENTMTLH